ncbi:hypothetical protein AKO1_008860 [Acrasis kona]|uniref:Uncharacterized protein n=1 Tax=Acrasis kona TaxID=1008807 RepID=A0AAW2ZDU9_9EUKA
MFAIKPQRHKHVFTRVIFNRNRLYTKHFEIGSNDGVKNTVEFVNGSQPPPGFRIKRSLGPISASHSASNLIILKLLTMLVLNAFRTINVFARNFQFTRRPNNEPLKECEYKLSEQCQKLNADCVINYEVTEDESGLNFLATGEAVELEKI